MPDETPMMDVASRSLDALNAVGTPPAPGVVRVPPGAKPQPVDQPRIIGVVVVPRQNRVHVGVSTP